MVSRTSSPSSPQPHFPTIDVVMNRNEDDGDQQVNGDEDARGISIVPSSSAIVGDIGWLTHHKEHDKLRFDYVLEQQEQEQEQDSEMSTEQLQDHSHDLHSENSQVNEAIGSISTSDVVTTVAATTTTTSTTGDEPRSKTERLIALIHRYRPPLNITHAFRKSKNDNLFSFGDEPKLRDFEIGGYLISSRKNKLRRIMKALIFNQLSQYLLVLCSIVSAVMIAVEPPPYDTQRWAKRNLALIILDIICTSVFTIDIVLRMCALLPHYFFMYDFPFNLIDLVVTITSWIPIIGPAKWMAYPMLRLFTRGIRPCKLFKNLFSFRIIVAMARKGIRELANMIILILFAMWVFALVGMLSFKGSLRRRCVVKETGAISDPPLFCKTTSNSSLSSLQFSCPDNQICVDIGSNPNGGYMHFDNLPGAMFQIFQGVTMEGWTDIFYAVQRAEYAYLTDIYFVLLVLSLAFLLMQLLLATIANIFEDVASSSHFLNSNYEAKSITLFGFNLSLQKGKQFLKTYSANIITNRRFSLLRVFEHRIYNAIISLIIICNITLLCLDSYKISRRFELAIYICEIIFTSLFCIEVILKIFSYNPLIYFSYNAFRFEFGLAIITFIGIFFPKVALLQCIRFLRLFRVLKAFKPFVKMMSDVFQRPIALSNLLLLLMYLIFTYAIIGMALFGGEFPDDESYNFNSFPKAFISTFQLCTVENWTDALLLGLSTKTWWMAHVYVISFLAISQYLILNCFIALILQNFSLSDEEKVELEKDVVEKMRKRSFYRPPKHFIERVKLLWTKISPRKFFAGKSMTDRKHELKRKRDSIVYSLDVASGYSWATIVRSQSDLALETPEEETWKAKLINRSRNYSLFILSPTNDIRETAQSVVDSEFFDIFIYFMISVSSIFLVFDSPLNENHGMFFNLNIFFNVLFTIEFIMKIVAKGFIFTDTAYIWKRNNFIDFIALISTWASFIQGPVHSLVWLRVFRFIRPLQLLSKSRSQKIQEILNAFLASIPSLAKLVLIWIVFMIFFGASAMLLFQGKLYKCNDSNIDHQKDCVGIYQNDLGIYVPRKYSKPVLHFDDLLNSISTLFAVSSTEGWLTVLDNTMSFTDYGLQPQSWNHPEYAIFFIIFITLFTFFLFDVSVGVIVEKTREIRGDALLTSKQKVYRYLEAIVSDMKPPTRKKVPNSRAGRLLFDTFGGFRKRSKRSHIFTVCVGLVIIAHSIVMSVQYYGQPRGLTLAVVILNSLFNVIYVIEVALKLIVVSPERYFRKRAFVYEFIVVVLGIMSCAVDYAAYFNRVNTSQVLIYLSRLVIVLRMLRLIKFFSFSIISRVLMVSLPYIVSLCASMFVFLLIFAIVGVDMCGKTKFGVALNPQVNFQNTYNAMLLLFRVITGENWPLIMQDCAVQYPDCDPALNDCGSNMSPFYFIIFQVVGANIVLSFIIAGIVDNFEWILAKESSFLGRGGVTKRYNSIWKKFDITSYHKGRLPIYQLRSFLIALGNPLGVQALQSSQPTTEDIGLGLSKEARWRYRLIRYEAESQSNISVESQGHKVATIEYNKLLLILLRHMINIDGLNYQERRRRKRELETMKEEIRKDIVRSFLLMCFHRRRFKKHLQEKNQEVNEVEESDTVSLNPFDDEYYSPHGSPNSPTTIHTTQE